MTTRKAPPPLTDPEMETALLGALLIEPGAVALVRSLMAATDFVDPARGIIFDAIESTLTRTGALDVASVAAELRTRARLNAVGGAQYLAEVSDVTLATTLAELRNGIATAAHAESWARQLARLATLRRAHDTLLAAAWEITTAAPEDALSAALARVEGIARESAPASMGSLEDACTLAWDELTSARGPHVVAPTGLAWLDGDDHREGMTGGLHSGALVVVGAEQGGGKTVMGWQFAENASIGTGRRALVFSLEMGRAELALRLACAVATRDGRGPLSMGRARAGKLSRVEHERLTEAMGAVASWPVDIDDAAGLTVEDIRARAHAHRARHGELSMVMVDYLGRLAPSKGLERVDERRQVAHITRRLKDLARELRCPVVLLSQLTRAGNRSGEPSMHDLYGGSAIESDADVILVWTADEGTGETIHRPGTLRLVKHRAGATGSERLLFLRDRGRFEPLVIDRPMPGDYRVERDEDYPPPSYGDAE